MLNDKRLGIENNNIVQYEVMKKFIEDTFPLNKIVTQEIDYEYGKIILKDFLKGISITPKPEMFKKIIRHIELEEFKLLTNDVLKENKDAKIYINLTKENIESILISQTFGVEILDHTSEEKYCILTLGT